MIETVGHLRGPGLAAPACVAVHAIFAESAFEDLRAAGAADIVSCDTIVHPSNRIALATAISAVVRKMLTGARSLSAGQLMTESTPGRHGPIAFPLGYHSLHPDVSLNFQMNRWFGWVGAEPEMLIEMGLAAKRIASYADWKREFLALASDACRRGHLLRAAFYWRSAEL